MSYKIEMREVFTCSRLAAHAFDYIVDFSRISEWDHTIVAAEKTSAGAIGLGTRFELVLAMGPRKVPLSYSIETFEHPNKAVFTGTSKNFTAVDTVLVKPLAEGCEVEWHAVIEFTGALARLAPLLSRSVKRTGRKTIEGLAEALHDNYSAPKIRPLQKVADALIVPGVLGFTRFGYNIANQHFKPVSASLQGKHVVITGATSGLGLATARELAHRGADLTLVARNKAKLQAVVKEITRHTGNPNIKTKIADLSLMQEVIALADSLLQQGRAIDVLINNAGALYNPRQETSEGLECSFALLLLAPYILTEKLHPLLQKSGAARVINVSSGGMYATGIALSNLQSDQGSYRGADAYARAKRGLVIMGERWSRHWATDGITVHNMHPGWAQTPGVETSLPEFTKVTKRVLRSPEQGADTIIWLAHATEVAQTSGLFWFDRFPHATNFTNKTKASAEKRDSLEQALITYRARFE